MREQDQSRWYRYPKVPSTFGTTFGDLVQSSRDKKAEKTEKEKVRKKEVQQQQPERFVARSIQ